MTLSLPFFLAIAWWLRSQPPRLERARLAEHRAARLPRLLRRELSRLHRPAVRRRRRRAPDPVPLSDAGAAAFVRLPQEAADGTRARGPRGELRRHRARGLHAHRADNRGAAVPVRRAAHLRRRVPATRCTSSPAVRWSSASARCASPPTAWWSRPLPAVVQFLVLEPASALVLPEQVWLYAIVLATFSTVLPVFLQAEALKRIGANHFAIIGAVGPVSVAITSAAGLDEPFTWVQALGGAARHLRRAARIAQEGAEHGSRDSRAHGARVRRLEGTRQGLRDVARARRSKPRHHGARRARRSKPPRRSCAALSK